MPATNDTAPPASKKAKVGQPDLRSVTSAASPDANMYEDTTTTTATGLKVADKKCKLGYAYTYFGGPDDSLI